MRPIALIVLALSACQTPTTPPVSEGPRWDDPETEALARRAGCFDCHSNETQWPWYTAVPLVGGTVVGHVQEGRRELNLSRMDRPQEEAHEAGEAVREGAMPPTYYVALHPSARLTDAERRRLARGLDATLGGEGEGEHAGEHGGEHESEEDDD